MNLWQGAFVLHVDMPYKRAIATVRGIGKAARVQSGRTFSIIYSAIVVTLAVALIVVMAVTGQFHWSVALTFLTVACTLTEWQVIRLPQGNTLTLSIIFVLLALVFNFGEMTTPLRQAVGALQVITFGALVGYGLMHRPPPLTLGFYVSHHALSAAAAGVAFVLLSAMVPYYVLDSFHVVGVIAYVVVYSLLSMLLVGPVNKRIIKGQKLPRAEILYTIFLAPIALIVYYFFDSRQLDIWSLLILALPLIGVLVTFSLYVNIDTTYGEINQLYLISREFVAAMSQEETVQRVSESIAQALSELVLQVDACLIYQHNADANEYRLVHPNGGTQVPQTVLPGRGFLGKAALEPTGDVATDIAQQDGLTPDEREWEPRTAVLAHPLVAEQRKVGLLVLVRQGKGFTAEEFRLVSIVAYQAGVTLHNAQLFEESMEKADTDPQLGLLNQTAFVQKAQRILARPRTEGQSHALLYGDIDDFRKVNNTYLHQSGDIVLAGFAKLWQEGAGESGLACRWGGEELAILLPDTGEQEALSTAEGIRRAVEDHVFQAIDGRDVRVTISTGVALCPRDAEDIEELVKFADRAQYLAKRSGKNRVCLYQDRKELIEEPEEAEPAMVGPMVQEEV